MNKTPVWKEIETTLSGEIAAGRYAPGDKLPTEAALGERFGVNRHTVRRALSEMQEGGLVLSRRGAGVFVAAKPAQYRLGRRVRFSENLARSGMTGDRTILRLETLPADQREAKALALTQGAPVVVLESVSYADGAPLALARSAFPAERLPGVAAALEAEKSITTALKTVGVEDYVRASTELTAHLATPTQAGHLKVREGAALLRAVSVNVDLDGSPVEYGRTLFAGDRIRLTVESG